MPHLFNGRELFDSSELGPLTDATAGYLAGLNPRNGEHHFSPRSIVFSYDRENRLRGGSPADWNAAHPALLAFFRDPYGVTDAPLSALASDGYPPDSPLSPGQLIDLLGPALASRAVNLFRDAAFFDAAGVEAVRSGYASALAETNAEAARRAVNRERAGRTDRGTGEPDERSQLFTFVA